MKMRIGTALTAAFLIAAAAAPALAGGEWPKGDAAAAKPLIATQCIKCHIVPGFPTDKIQPAVNAPPFVEIARNKEKYPEEALRKFLLQPHYPMKGFVMSKRDIANILAFLKTLGGRETK